MLKGERYPKWLLVFPFPHFAHFVWSKLLQTKWLNQILKVSRQLCGHHVCMGHIQNLIPSLDSLDHNSVGKENGRENIASLGSLNPVQWKGEISYWPVDTILLLGYPRVQPGDIKCQGPENIPYLHVWIDCLGKWIYCNYNGFVSPLQSYRLSLWAKNWKRASSIHRVCV